MESKKLSLVALSIITLLLISGFGAAASAKLAAQPVQKISATTVSGAADVPTTLTKNQIMCKADLDRDRDVDQSDLDLFMPLYGKSKKDFNTHFWRTFAKNADFDNNEKIDFSDLLVILSRFGQPCN